MTPQRYSDGDPNNFENDSRGRNGVLELLTCDAYGHNNLQRVA